MTRPIQLNKTYGVLHTENYFSFLGFAKKVGSDEIQKIDVFSLFKKHSFFKEHTNLFKILYICNSYN